MDALDAAPLCPSPHELRLERVTFRSDQLVVLASTRRHTVACPTCGHATRRVHSRYRRRLADLPWHGLRVRLEVATRRFFCGTPDCPRQIFTERLPHTAVPHARRTTRAASALEVIGFALGGRAGARLAGALGLSVGRAVLLASVRAAVPPDPPPPRVLGVDDWSGRRGRTYGTMLVDLERHRVLDLLPDREAATLATWLRAHPSVEIIARDRSSAYADAARLAAPRAIQVADRFHLLRNVTDAIDRSVARHHLVVRAVAAACGELPRPPVRRAPRGPTHEEREMAERRARRLARYEQVMALHARGMAGRAIARTMSVDRATVRAWLRAERFPERRARGIPQPTALDAFAAYVLERYDAGLDNARLLERELRPLGYRGSYTAVRRYLGRLRRTRIRSPTASATAQPHTRTPAFSAREAVWLLQKPTREHTPRERVFVEQLTAQCPALRRVRKLALAFRSLFRRHDAEALEPWLAAARSSELRSFARGLDRDLAAVRAALVLPWSTGQVEGHVHRLKFIKRSMYGRARFDLLRARVLHAG